MRSLLLCIAYLGGSLTSGFQTVSYPSCFIQQGKRRLPHSLPISAAPKTTTTDRENGTNVMMQPTYIATTACRSIDEITYNFNKALIDTVYEVICFVYPVTGKERDFARFYVLETVARVPYFAYLSVMHLRGTTPRLLIILLFGPSIIVCRTHI